MDLWLDLTGSHARPPADVVAEATTYGLLGSRLDLGFGWGTASATARLGNAVDGADGRWLQGELALGGGGRLGAVAARADLAGFALHYLDPYDYTAAGLELRPRLGAARAGSLISLLPVLSFGRWSSEEVEGDLLVAGGDLEIQRPLGPVTATVSAGAVHVANGVTTGRFVRGQAGLAYTGTGWRAGVRAIGQRTPLESELGGVLTLSAYLGPAVQLSLYAGRTLRDPLYGADGTFVVSTGLAVRPLHREPETPAPVVEVGARVTEGRRVRFTLRDANAERVELTGDFTGWEPLPMERTGRAWTLDRVLPPGVHHFGFLVDGTWSVPADAPGLVDDGWGRQNASVVIEP